MQALLDLGITSCSAIAREVGCHKSTISREIRRGSVLQRDHNYLLYEHYYADTARSIIISDARTAISVIR
nr:helix-turn-helix domain-containing protein [Lactobacillus helveticus]